MINMGYCRFNNTKMALDECLEALQEGRTLSNEEFRKCKQMFKNIVSFLEDEGVIEDDGELYERMEEFFETIDVEGDD